MVEAALVLPVFFLFVLGMIEFSRLGMVAQLITSAANTGCRVAVINGHTQADVTTTVQNLMSSGGIGTSSYTMATIPTDVTTSHHGDPVFDSVTVSISVPFRNVSWLSTSLFLGSVTVKSSATLSSERP